MFFCFVRCKKVFYEPFFHAFVLCQKTGGKSGHENHFYFCWIIGGTTTRAGIVLDIKF
jgi:hypothetical protein